MATVMVADTRALGYCVRGQRRWFEKHGINFAEFVAEGVDADVLRATGDALGIAAAEAAETRERQQKKG